MIELQRNQIRLQAKPSDKHDAIRQVGQLLVESGCIEPGYIDSMMGREAVANTYLGNGLTIPHGLPQDRHLIQRTGIAVLQVPDGVTWNAGETAQLVVGIAAKSDEHIDILRRLTRVLGNKAQVARLTQTNDALDIIEALTGERPEEPRPAQADFAHSFDIILANPSGLHARPATIFVDLAKQFEAEVRVRCGDHVADGKSMLALLQLGAQKGASLRVSAQGKEAERALQALKTAIEAGLGDEPAESSAIATVAEGHSWQPENVKAAITGITAAGGLAIGVARQYLHYKIVVEDQPADRFSETIKFQNALDAAKTELETLHDEMKARVGAGKAAIFRAHAEFLNDPGMIQDAIALVYQGHSAAWSWQQVVSERVSQVEKLDDPVLASRAVDLSDVGQRVLRHIMGMADEKPMAPDTPVILIADDLRPSDTAALNTDVILGFCTAGGGPTSHTAIIAKSLGIPAVVAAGEMVLGIANGTPGILDGYNGKLYLEPSQADVLAAREVQRGLRNMQEAANATRHAPAVTKDGRRVEVAANINRAAEARRAIDAGAEGVGLMRTEFLFLERDSVPSEDEQFEAYRDVVRALEGRPLIIRTLDIGGDKEVPYLNLPKEDNSFLGLRGIRLCLARPEMFQAQLRAIYRAAAFGPLKIMFPMIATLEDFENARAFGEQVRQDMNAPAVEYGIMVEVPSAALLADHFAKEVSFFSIGTNDLTQYVLAMDRLHPQLAKQADGLHPAILRMIQKTVQAAQTESKWVGVCGGIAGDPKGALILAGLGVSELSVTIPSVPTVKALIRDRSLAEMQALAEKALQCRTAAEVRAL
jgi:phosphocarrier protein FPr